MKIAYHHLSGYPQNEQVFDGDVDDADSNAFFSKPLTKSTLIRESRFTKYMAEGLNDLLHSDRQQTVEGEVNQYFSPACFQALNAWIHLLPLWSKCSVQMVLAEGTVVPQTNGKVEQYFRTLKKGTACDRKRLRPRELVSNELTRILGALNERKLPNNPVAGTKNERSIKRSATTLDAELDFWSDNRKKKAKYSNPNLRKRLLTPKSKRQKTAHESADHDGVDIDVISPNAELSRSRQFINLTTGLTCN